MARPRTFQEDQAFRQGALREAELQVEGMTKEGRQVYDFVHVCAQQGRSGERIAVDTAIVFLSHLAWKTRWRVIKKLLRLRRQGGAQ